MSITDGPIVPSKIGNDQLWLPTVSWPDLVLASVFASMSEPSGFFARRTRQPVTVTGWPAQEPRQVRGDVYLPYPIQVCAARWSGIPPAPHGCPTTAVCL